MEPPQEEQIVLNNDLERKIYEAFEVFDHAGNKTVDSREIGTIVRSLGCCPTEAEVQEMVVLYLEEPASPGTIHVNKFIPFVSQFLTEHKYQPATPDVLLEAFHVLDPLGKGYVTKEYISTLVTQDGEPFNQDELDEMLEIAIDPHTQTVPYEYYINQLMHEVPPGTSNYDIADAIEAAKPQAQKPKSFLDILQRMQSKIEESIKSLMNVVMKNGFNLFKSK